MSIWLCWEILISSLNHKQAIVGSFKSNSADTERIIHTPRKRQRLVLAKISEAMLIKEMLVLFTSAVRSKGGFFKACLKEVSIAPVIFITSVQIHLRTLTPSDSQFTFPSRTLVDPGWKNPGISCPRQAEHGWSLLQRTDRELLLLQ